MLKTKTTTKTETLGIKTETKTKTLGLKTKTKTKTFKIQSRDVSRPRLKSRELKVWFFLGKGSPLAVSIFMNIARYYIGHICETFSLEITCVSRIKLMEVMGSYNYDDLFAQ